MKSIIRRINADRRLALNLYAIVIYDVINLTGLILDIDKIRDLIQDIKRTFMKLQP